MPSEPVRSTPSASTGDIEALGPADKPSASDLDAWLGAQIEGLRRTHDQLVSSDFRLETLLGFLEIAQDLQAKAVNLGYPLASAVALSLCHLIDGTPDTDRLPRILVRQHVDAICAIVAERASGGDHPIGRTLTERLRSVTDEFVETESAKAVAA